MTLVTPPAVETGPPGCYIGARAVAFCAAPNTKRAADMAQFSVWVSGGEGQPHIILGETSDGQAAAAAVGGILGLAGTHAFDVGVSVTGGSVPAPTGPAGASRPAEQGASQPPGEHPAGGAAARHAVPPRR